MEYCFVVFIKCLGDGDNKLVVCGKTCFVHIEQVYISEIGEDNCNLTDFFHTLNSLIQNYIQYRSLAYQDM